MGLISFLADVVKGAKTRL